MADASSSLPPRRLGSLADGDDDDLEEGQFVPAAHHSSSDTDNDDHRPLQRARRPGRLISMEEVLALGHGDALPYSTTPSSESDGTISDNDDDDGNPSPASVFKMMEPKPKRKRVAVALDAGWATTGKRGWAGGKLEVAAAAAAAPTLNTNPPQSSSHYSNVSGDSSSSSSSAQAVAVAAHINQTPAPPHLPSAEQAQPVHLHHQPVAAQAQLPHQLVVVPQRAAAAAADHPPRRVYTCRECGRTFPTNQALGGHAAGHRSRQREAEAAAAAAGMMRELGEDGAAEFLAALRRARSREEEAPHECRKCHKVFATGVALGGHMRVHYTGPPIVPARRNKKRCLAMQPVEDIAAAAAAPPPPDLSLAMSIKTEEAAPPAPAAAPAGGVRAVRLFGIDISPQVRQGAPSEQQCSGTTTTGDDYSSAGGQQ